MEYKAKFLINPSAAVLVAVAYEIVQGICRSFEATYFTRYLASGLVALVTAGGLFYWIRRIKKLV